MYLRENALTRVSVIDHSEVGSGLEFERYGVRVELRVQDDGRTLKVFIYDDAEGN